MVGIGTYAEAVVLKNGTGGGGGGGAGGCDVGINNLSWTEKYTRWTIYYWNERTKNL